MPRGEYPGPFEQLVLIAILGLDENAYGVSIHKKVQSLALPKTVSLGAIYVTLDRLEAKGLIASRLSEPTAERGGRAKRCYCLEAAGKRALQEAAVMAQRMWESVGWGSDLMNNWKEIWGKPTS
jgi:DNA-binding PadR family transcriptional regulator